MMNGMNELPGQPESAEIQGLAGQGQQGLALLQQVIKLLMSGVTPEELMQKGVPPEVIQAAIEQIQQEAPRQAQGQTPQGPVGLAQMSVQGPA